MAPDRPMTFLQGVSLGGAQGNTLGGATLVIYGLVTQTWVALAIGVAALIVGLFVWRAYGWRLHS